MEASAKKKSTSSGNGYRGKQTRTGNSSGFRFESALFKSHPEFNGNVVAHVLAPGRLLVTAESKKEAADPIMESFLAFLGRDIATSPEAIRPLDDALVGRIDALVKGVKVRANEPLADEVVL